MVKFLFKTVKKVLSNNAFTPTGMIPVSISDRH